MGSKIVACLLALGLLGAAVPDAMAQAAPTAPADTTAVKATAPAPVATPAPAPAPAPASPSKPNDRVYYGGTVTLGFGETTRIGIFPMLGYKLTPKLSAGVEVGYEYLSYDGGESTHNYGASVFGNYRIGRSLYAHAEYQGVNYEVFSAFDESDREWVPFLLVGGGFYKPISPRTSLYAEVLFDVLQDERSPYDDWEPIVNIGVGVGF
jgi:hypothetical protein